MVANPLTLFELKRWHNYALTRDVTCVDGHLCEKGSVVRYMSSMLHLNGKGANVHAKTREGRAVEFRIGSWEADAWFVPQPRVEPYADREKLRALLSWHPGMERACQILAGNISKGNWGSAQRDGDTLWFAALEMERSGNGPAAKALAEESLSAYYSWLSQATSGGEGTAMEREVSPRIKELERLLSGG